MNFKDFHIFYPARIYAIGPSGIWMHYENSSSKKVSFLQYFPKTDTFVVILKGKEENELLDILNTKIPNTKVPEECRKIIDDNLEKYSDFDFTQDIHTKEIIKGKAELGIEEDDKGIVLTKKRKLKFYE